MRTYVQRGINVGIQENIANVIAASRPTILRSSRTISLLNPHKHSASLQSISFHASIQELFHGAPKAYKYKSKVQRKILKVKGCFWIWGLKLFVFSPFHEWLNCSCTVSMKLTPSYFYYALIFIFIIRILIVWQMRRFQFMKSV